MKEALGVEGAIAFRVIEDRDKLILGAYADDQVAVIPGGEIAADGRSRPP